MATDDVGGRGIERPALLIMAMALSLFEGIDLASMGAALPQLSRVLALDARQAGAVASASMFGIVVGSILFGRLADLYGQTRVMLGTGLGLGFFCAATPSAWDFPSLFAIRFLAGLGMGGLLPIIVGMGAASAAPRTRATAISFVMGIGPVGGILAGMIALTAGWQTIFWVGGLGPVFLVILGTALRLTGNIDKQEVATASLKSVFFKEGRAGSTLLIWTAAFCAVMTNYVMINWLPSLLVGEGRGDRAGSIALMTYSAGCVFGNIFTGWLIDRHLLKPVAFFAFGGAAVLIVALSQAASSSLFPIIFVAASCIIAGQLITIVLTPRFYPAVDRTVALGATLSVGRIGAALGPLFTGELLHLGLSSSSTILLLVPVLLVALLATVALSSKKDSVGARQDCAVPEPVEELGR